MNNTKKISLFVIPVLLLLTYAFWYLATHNFVSIAIKTSHRTQLTILWSDTITNPSTENLNQFSSVDVTIYPLKNRYIFALPKTFDFANVKSLVISAHDRVNIETAITRFYIFDKGDTIYKSDSSKTFRRHFAPLDNSVEFTPNGIFRVTAIKQPGYFLMLPDVITNVQNDIKSKYTTQVKLKN